MRYRTPRRLSAGVAAVAITLSGLAALAGPASADTAPPVPAYYPSGPQTGVPVSTVTNGGWTQCYLGKYAENLGPAVPTVLSSCTGKYLMLAGRPTGSSTLSLLAAAPRDDVLFRTGDNDVSTSHLANGSQWYFSTTQSWGFAPGGEAVSKNSCDTLAGPLRLCWHTHSGGYRIGDTKGLNSSSAYERVVYQSEGLPAQSITYTSAAPSPGRVDDTYDVTTTGGASGKPVTLSSGTPSVCTVQAARVTFLDEGTCTVLADQEGDQDYLAAKQTSQTITVVKRAQTITFGSTAPSSAYVGQTYQASASSDSALPVTLRSGTPEVCTVDPDGLVTFVAAGRCTVQADQEGGRAHQAATRTSQSFVVDQITPLVTVTTPTGTVSGESVRVSASLSVAEDAPGTIPAGTVQFSVDGTDLGDPVVVSDGGAESPAFARGAGDHAVSARFVPTDTTTYGAATGAGTLGVAQAPTTTTVSVTGSDLTALVSTDAPGAGIPTGTVSFLVAGEEVGRARLDDGVAVLPYVVAPGQSRKVSAAYLGDEDRAGSVDSVTREDPTIAAAQSSSTPRTAAGWYRTPVRIDYTCTTATAELATSCPASDTVSEEGAGTTVTRTVSAVDGGIGSVTSTVNLDRTAPTVSLRGPTAGKRYFAAAPEATCVGSDVLSGLDSCTVSTSKGRDGAETVTATATDKAGNVARTSTSYVVVRYAVAGADYVNGAWVVHRGTGIAVLAQTTGTPTYRLASTSPANLARAGTRRMVRTGKDTWAYGATVNMVRTPNGIWYLGVQTGRTITPVKIRMIG